MSVVRVACSLSPLATGVSIRVSSCTRYSTPWAGGMSIAGQTEIATSPSFTTTYVMVKLGAEASLSRSDTCHNDYLAWRTVETYHSHCMESQSLRNSLVNLANSIQRIIIFKLAKNYTTEGCAMEMA